MIKSKEVSLMLKERLPVLRRSKGWTMKRMAEELCIPYTTYVGYEKGVREPPMELLVRMARLFGVSVDTLLGREDSPALGDEDIKFALFGNRAGEITDEMYEQVKNFAAFLEKKYQQKD